MSVFSKLVATAAVLLGIGALPAQALTVNWAEAFALTGSDGGLDNPAILVGFNPQPDPPGAHARLELADPTTPTLVLPDQHDPQLFRFFFAWYGGPDTVDFDLPPLTGDDLSTYSFLVRGDGSVHEVQLHFSTASGGIADGASLVGFNPQPDPPRGIGNPTTMGLEFAFTSLSDATISFQIITANDQTLRFTEVPAPGSLPMLAVALLGLAAGFCRRTATLAGLGLLLAVPAQALVVDDFNDGTLVIATPGFGTIDAAGAVGGERDMVGSFWFGTFASNAGNNGLLQIAATEPDVATIPGYDIRYDGDDNTTANNFLGLAGVDLTDGGASNALRVRVVRSSAEVNLGIELSEQKTPGDNTFASIQMVLPVVATPTDFLLLFADFSNPGCNFCDDASPLNFDNVDWMEVSFSPVTQAPFSLAVDFIDTVAVPAPATLSLLGVGLLGLRVVRRRRVPFGIKR